MDSKKIAAIVALVTALANVVLFYTGGASAITCTVADGVSHLQEIAHAAIVGG